VIFPFCRQSTGGFFASHPFFIAEKSVTFARSLANQAKIGYDKIVVF